MTSTLQPQRVVLTIAVAVLISGAAFAASFIATGEKERIPARPLELKEPKATKHGLAAKLVASRFKTKQLSQIAFALLTTKERRLATAVYYKVLEAEPDNYFAMYNLACAHSLMNQAEESIFWLQECARHESFNIDWAEKDKDLELIRKDRRFWVIIKYAEKVVKERVKVKKSENLIAGPKRKAKKDEKFPVLLWLHGRGNNPHILGKGLEKFCDRHDLVLVAPAGPGDFGKDRYTWDGGFNSSFEAIERALDEAAKKFPIDRNKLITCGFSQGGGVALEMLVKKHKRVYGAIAFCPAGVPRVQELPDGALKDRLMLIVADGPAKPVRSKRHDYFKKKGAFCVVHQIPGLGHTLPPEHLTYMEGWLMLILEKMR